MSSVHRPELDQHPDSRHPAAADRPGPVIEPSTAILRAGAVAATRWQGFERTSRRALGDLAGALHMSAGALWLATGGTLAPRTGRRAELGISPLTAREIEVLELAAEGLTGRCIAEQLEISPSTVKTHFEHIFRRLGVRDRTSALARAIRCGLIA